MLRNYERKLYPQVVSLRESKLIPEEENTTPVSPLTDLTPSEKPDKIITSNIINNIDCVVTPTTDFNSKEELLKWKNSPQRWLHILGVYGLWRRVDDRLKTKATLNKLLPEFRKIATDLADFTDDQLRDAFKKCDGMKDKEGQGFDWTLRTVKKVLLK
jgi:hypothetical protein